MASINAIACACNCDPSPPLWIGTTRNLQMSALALHPEALLGSVAAQFGPIRFGAPCSAAVLWVLMLADEMRGLLLQDAAVAGHRPL